jgi:hypothetical protein
MACEKAVLGLRLAAITSMYRKSHSGWREVFETAEGSVARAGSRWSRTICFQDFVSWYGNPHPLDEYEELELTEEIQL